MRAERPDEADWVAVLAYGSDKAPYKFESGGGVVLVEYETCNVRIFDRKSKKVSLRYYTAASLAGRVRSAGRQELRPQQIVDDLQMLYDATISAVEAERSFTPKASLEQQIDASRHWFLKHHVGTEAGSLPIYQRNQISEISLKAGGERLLKGVLREVVVGQPSAIFQRDGRMLATLPYRMRFDVPGLGTRTCRLFEIYESRDGGHFWNARSVDSFDRESIKQRSFPDLPDEFPLPACEPPSEK